jgi:hypothetical protein
MVTTRRRKQRARKDIAKAARQAKKVRNKDVPARAADATRKDASNAAAP